ncbi:hypothetical protein DL93DRAFT_2088361 [Clavulina sp. PMI_390]|nr:hypothetical protein DL93DRAFT_2088361 [Clavulina sp. PMI_390]
MRLASEHRIAVRRERARAHNSLQPLVRAPVEVLSRILQLTAERSDDIKPLGSLPIPPYLHGSPSFHAMRSLCHHLWHVALRSPQCWRNVTVFITDLVTSTSPFDLEKILARSQNCTFNLTLYVDSGSVNSFIVRGPLGVIRPHAWRCRSIRVCSGYRDIKFSEVASLIRRYDWNLPSLRAVSLINLTSIPINEPIRRNPGIEYVPFWNKEDGNIESAELQFEWSGQTVVRMPRVADLALPLATLKRLRIVHGFDTEFIVRLLQSCPQLECFDWQAVQERFLEAFDTPVKLPRIRSLQLRGWALQRGALRFGAPRCEKLCISEALDPEGVVTFLHVHSRKSDFPQIKRLAICLHELSEPLLQFFSSHPLLEELIITAPSVGSTTNQRCEMFDGLAFYASHNTPSSHILARQSSFLPALRLVYYHTTLDEWVQSHEEQLGVAPALAESLRRFLRCRDDLSINLIFQLLPGETLPREVVMLMAEFRPRLTIVPGRALPEWAVDWQSYNES